MSQVAAGGVDARKLSSYFASRGSFAACVTSPPYWGLRRYGASPDEIGAGSLGDYINDLLLVGQGVHDMMDDAGVWWLNLGDTSSGSGGAGGDYNIGGRMEGRPKYKQGRVDLPHGQQCLVPWRVAAALQDEGWMVRQTITWAKMTKDGGRNRVRPEDPAHVRRPLFSSEVIFMLTKGMDHRFCPRPKEEVECGNVWHFPPAKNSGHLAPFPDELVRRCLLLTFADDEMVDTNWVIDPFGGSGTTSRVAEDLGLSSFSLDLY